jgi:superfamily I DNA/RNA helicase/RecB family exonuclease
MTWPAYAFDIISRAEASGLIPWMRRQPRLRTGAEQDHLFSELLRRVPAESMPSTVSLARETVGLRQQLRDFADQAIQVGADPRTDIQALAAKHRRPEWALAGTLMEEYRAIDALSANEALDALELSLTASQILRENPDFLSAERSAWSRVLVDDAQNLTMPELRLLQLLVADQPAEGALPVLAAFDEGSTVQAFRGADPARVARFLRESAARAVDLGETRRATGDAARVYSALRSRLPRVPVAEDLPAVAVHRDGSHSEESAGPEQEGRVEAHIVVHPFHELRLIGTMILECAVTDEAPVDYSEIAVIVRSSGLARQLERQLTTLGIPVEIPPAVLTLKETPAVRPLIDAMRLVVSDEAPDPVTLTEILTSPLIGLTAVDVRQLRQELRRRERQRVRDAVAARDPGDQAPEPHVRLSDELLVEASLDPVASRDLRGMGVLSEMIARGRRAYDTLDKDPQQVLWALWESAGKAQPWRAAAAQPGRGGDTANRSLDAVMSLFHAAERFMDQRPGATSDEFLAELLEQEIPMDTVAKRGRRRSAVSILTPAAAAGREFRVVFLAGVQEGVWPNPKVRGEIFGTTDFLEALEAERRGESFAPSPHRDRVNAIKRDELRLFLTAFSRATRRVIVTAVRGDDQSPSAFFDLVASAVGVSTLSADPTIPPRPRTLRSLVGELRQAAEFGGEVGHEPFAEDAAEVLAVLSSADADHQSALLASPEGWWASRPISSTGPVLPGDAPIPMSPSKVEKAMTDPLGWFVQSIGGEPAVDFSRQLGTIIHEIAEKLPMGTETALFEELDRIWDARPSSDGLTGAAERARAEHLVRSFAKYVHQTRKEGRSIDPEHVEQSFELQVPTEVRGQRRNVTLRGTIDRLEQNESGSWFVVDLKTGATHVTKAEGEKHPQMAIYQLAAARGGLDAISASDGALLVFLGKPNAKSVSTVAQPAERIVDLALEYVDLAAAVMTSSEFESIDNGTRRRSQLPDIDPLLPQGQPVTRVEKLPTLGHDELDHHNETTGDN